MACIEGFPILHNPVTKLLSPGPSQHQRLHTPVLFCTIQQQSLSVLCPSHIKDTTLLSHPGPSPLQRLHTPVPSCTTQEQSFSVLCPPHSKDFTLLPPSQLRVINHGPLLPSAKGCSVLSPCIKGCSVLSPCTKGCSILSPCTKGCSVLSPCTKGSSVLRPVPKVLQSFPLYQRLFSPPPCTKGCSVLPLYQRLFKRVLYPGNGGRADPNK